MTILQIILVVLIALLAGMEGILDEFEFHQPLLSCTLIGLATGHLRECLYLGGYMQLIVLGWANLGASLAPDVCLSGVSAGILTVCGLNANKGNPIFVAIAIAIPLSIVGKYTALITRQTMVNIMRKMETKVDEGDIKAFERLHFFALILQGLRVAVPSLFLILIARPLMPILMGALGPEVLKGIEIGCRMLPAVGFAIVMNVLSAKEVWPFFGLGFCLAGVTDLSIIMLGVIGFLLALIYISLKVKQTSSSTEDPLGDILDDY